MSPRIVYRFFNIYPNATAGLFLHGMGDGFTSFSYRVWLGNYVGHPVSVEADVTDNEYIRHVDGTMARRIHVHNPSENNIQVDVILNEDDGVVG